MGHFRSIKNSVLRAVLTKNITKDGHIMPGNASF